MSVSAMDAAFVRDLVHKRAAIVLDEEKHYLIETRLEALIRDGAAPSVSELVASARRGDAAADKKIVEAITTHETSFFRDRYPFDDLAAELPALAAARRQSKSFTIWAAACSSGQEPYSLAMLLHEKLPELATWPARIMATDLSDQVLSRARQGAFSQIEVNRGLAAAMLLKYFDRDGATWKVKEPVRKLVSFSSLNLLDQSKWPARADVVFLRNVLIYFDVETKRTILDRLRSVIAPDGLLFLGAAETTLNIHDGWQRVATEKSAFYRKRP